MDIGDIVFLLILGLGFLSSIGGARKKKRGRPPPKARVPQAGPPQPARKSRLAEARERALSQMEELLRDLEGGGKPSSQPTPEPHEQPAEEVTVESSDDALPPTAPVARELPPSVPAVRDGTLHKDFHDKYIQAVPELNARSSIPRSTQYLSSKSLREAVLLREILGPPKGLQ